MGSSCSLLVLLSLCVWLMCSLSITLIFTTKKIRGCKYYVCVTWVKIPKAGTNFGRKIFFIFCIKSLKMRAFRGTAVYSHCSRPTFQRCLLPPSSGWWLWRQYAPLKRWSIPRLHGAISQKALIFILATMRSWTLTMNNLVSLHVGKDLILEKLKYPQSC
jgi:hypothetical protein